MMSGFRWENFIGQKPIKRELRSLLKENLNILLRGHYGYGKTTIAKIYASFRGNYVYYAVPPREISTLGVTTIIDEIHLEKRLEKLFQYMEEGVRSMVFCTTNSSGLSGAFKSRCIQMTMAAYTPDDIVKIILTTLKRRGVNIYPSLAVAIMLRSHSNPRIAIILADRIRRLLAMDKKEYNLRNTLAEFQMLGIDQNGFDNRHRAYIQYLKNAGKPVGLKTLSSSLGMDVHTIQEEIELQLLQKDLIVITPRGRKIR